jgi:hypothetical protein
VLAAIEEHVRRRLGDVLALGHVDERAPAVEVGHSGVT